MRAACAGIPASMPAANPSRIRWLALIACRCSFRMVPCAGNDTGFQKITSRVRRSRHRAVPRSLMAGMPPPCCVPVIDGRDAAADRRMNGGRSSRLSHSCWLGIRSHRPELRHENRKRRPEGTQGDECASRALQRLRGWQKETGHPDEAERRSQRQFHICATARLGCSDAPLRTPSGMRDGSTRGLLLVRT